MRLFKQIVGVVLLLFALATPALAAHTYDTKAASTWATTNPKTLSYTCGAGTTLLVLMIEHTQVARTGGDPTYNGVAMTQVGAEVRNAQEVGVEMWYMVSPPTGSAYTISVPNTGAQSMQINVASFIAQAGYTSALDQNTSTNVDAQSPSLNRTTTVNGDVCLDVMGSGYLNPPTARSHTLLYTLDPGALTFETQYALQASFGLITMSHTNGGSDDIAMIMACFKEVVAVTHYSLIVDSGSISLTGTAATPRASRKLPVAGGSLSEAGSAISFGRGYSLAIGSGSFTESGISATFARTWAIVAGAGSYVLTGSDASLHPPAAHLHAYAGTYAVTGVDATFRRGFKFSAGVDSLSLAGAGVSFKYDRVMPEGPSSLGITGGNATFRRTYVMIASAGTFVYTGTPADLGIDTAGSSQNTLQGGGLGDNNTPMGGI